jgi:hypothetical protein
MGRKAVHALSQHERLRDEAIKPDIACLFYGDLDTETPEQFILRQEEDTLLRRGIDKLPVRAACVLRCRYGFGCEPMTLDRIGEMLGVGKERVRQIQARAERHLRRILKTDFVERTRGPPKGYSGWTAERYEARDAAAEAAAEAARQAVREAEWEREARRQVVATRQPVYPQFAKPSCNDPVNRYCNFYAPRVTNAATGEWEWVQYDPSTAQV